MLVNNKPLGTVYRALWRSVVILFLAFFLGSCSVTDRTSYEDDEGAVPESFFSSIKKNKTQKKWIVHHLGKPLSAYYTSDNKEIVTYQIRRAKYRNASLLLFMRYNSVRRDPRYFHVLLDNDVVKKTWWDEHSIPQWKLDQGRTPESSSEMSNTTTFESAKSVVSRATK